MEFVDRVEEQQRLNAALNAAVPAFIVVYGRRRIGKSTLLKKVLSPTDVYYMADQILKLSPIPLHYLQEAAGCSAQSAIEEYAVWGGIPRYWEIRLQSASLMEAIAYNLLDAQGLLFEEPYRLFIDDMRDIVQASTLLSFIGNGVNRISEIAARANKPATSLSGPLDKLITLGYIQREIPFGESPRNSKKGLYKISDPLMDFYFRFVVPNRSLIELGRRNTVMQEVTQGFKGYVSWHWEELCRRAVSGQTLMGSQFGMASRWWGSVSRDEQMEIDVVAESTDGKYLLAGECKWADKEDTGHLLKQVAGKAKKLPFLANKEIVPVVFVKKSKAPAENIILPDQIIEMLR